MTPADEALVNAAAESAQANTPATASLLRAIALTRTEAERHELARQAEARLAVVTDVALQTLKVIFSIK